MELENELKSTVLKEGCVSAGIARREAFTDAPPSADMRYLKPWANAVVAYAVTLDPGCIPDYLGKVTRMVMRDNKYDVYHNLYRIGLVLADRLKRAGFKAHPIVPNGLYRPEHTFEKKIPDHDLKPPVSLRYMAVGAGVGSFGWSGNVMVPGYWSNVYLGGVLTDARLEPDSPLEENVCDNCRICAQVCPVEFINKREKTSVIIAGREFTYNRKRGDLRCLIGCGGYTGLARNGKWSSWSTGRTILPENDAELPKLFAKLRNDPANTEVTRNITFGTLGILDRPRETGRTTCNNCGIVCSGPLEVRKKLRDLLFSSGVVELDEQGREVVVRTSDDGRETRTVARV